MRQRALFVTSNAACRWNKMLLAELKVDIPRAAIVVRKSTDTELRPVMVLGMRHPRPAIIFISLITCEITYHATRRGDRGRIQEKMIKMRKRPFSILKKRLPGCLRLGNWKRTKIAPVRWHLGNFPRHYRYLRRMALLVANNAVCLISTSGYEMGTETLCNVYSC